MVNWRHTDLYEARAILLGRMGRHDHALELYAYKIGDFNKAEEYACLIFLYIAL